MLLFTPALSLLCTVTADRWIPEGMPTFWEPEAYPSPRINPSQCALEEVGWVCDPNGILSEQELEAVNKAASELRSETECGCLTSRQCDRLEPHGYSLAVAIVPNMALPPGLSRKEKTPYAAKFAKKLQERYKIGQCEDDIIIFLSVNDRILWTAVGDRVSQVLTEDQLSGLYKIARSEFVNGQYAEGFVKIIRAYQSRLSPSGDVGDGGAVGWLIAVLGLLT